MTSTMNACACHSNLGIESTTVPDDVLNKLRGVNTPTISLVLLLARHHARELWRASRHG